ncbi:MAG: hypothetical protein IKK57_04470 [Clostridia bacterium]|nr:hypothetical protein [Clostridia bacterium]
MYYFGFDLGDGESCVTWSRDITANEPTPIAVAGRLSFISAVAMMGDVPMVGSLASADNPALTNLQVCFKRHFLEDRPEINEAIRHFAQGVMNALRQNEAVRDIVDDPEQACFIVGCPAGWKEEARARYRHLLTEAGMPNVRLASESRAAFETALRRRMDGVDAAMIEDCVLVIDIGSSTLDLAYVCDGEEHSVEVVGDVKLGGGLMDEMIVQHALRSMCDPAASATLQDFLQRNPAWYSRIMLEARALKERYFQHEEHYFATGEALEKFIRIPGLPGVSGLNIRLDPEIVQFHIISRPHPLLDGMSFESRLSNTLKNVHQRIREREPKIVILTGGPSRMRFFREMCEEEFTHSAVIVSDEPEFDIARGLAWAGSVDEGAARLLSEMRAYIASDAVENLVTENMDGLIASVAQALGEKLMKKCVLQTFRMWREGQLETLKDFEDRTGGAIAAYLRSAEGQQVIQGAVKPWTQALMNHVQTALDDIARAHGVSLGRLHSGRIRLGSGDEEISGANVAASFVVIVQTIVTLVTGIVLAMLCGGSGAALIASGPVGVFVGIIIALAAGILGSGVVRATVMNLRIPKPLRLLFAESAITTPRNQERTAQSICSALTADGDFVADMTRQISELIDGNLATLLRDSEVQFVA